MTKPKTKNVYPDHTFEDAARAAGATVQCLWQATGPKSTLVAWQECLQVNASLVIIQTYEGGGWEAFTTCKSNSVERTIADALNRCGVPVHAHPY